MVNVIYKIIERIENSLYIIYLKLRYLNKIKIGKHVFFRKHINIRIEKNSVLIIGDNCFFNNYCSINCMNYIEIGKNNLFGENVKIYDHDHKINVLNRSKSFNFGKIVIKNNNWIGSNCIILRKCRIGSNNVISCNTIVNFSIDDNNLIKNNSNIKQEKIHYI